MIAVMVCKVGFSFQNQIEIMRWNENEKLLSKKWKLKLVIDLLSKKYDYILSYQSERYRP